MNREEAKTILLLYRPGLADAADPQVAEALMLAKCDPELTRWLEEHCARQNSLSNAFREIAVPAGLKEQIISEQSAMRKMAAHRRSLTFATLAAAVAGLILLAVLALPFRPADDTFAIFRSRMVKVALRGYAMDLVTNNAAEIRSYLARNHAPADYVLPASLQPVKMVGCAVERWQDAKVSMICFHTGKPLPPGQQADLWLFVVDRASVKSAPETDLPQFAAVNRLVTAAWVRDGKLYLLETAGNAPAIRPYL